jgi:hypothetical protein
MDVFGPTMLVLEILVYPILIQQLVRQTQFATGMVKYVSLIHANQYLKRMVAERKVIATGTDQLVKPMDVIRIL